MILSFSDKITQDLYNGISNKKLKKLPPDIKNAACRKLDMIQYAFRLTDLLAPPANRLEALKGDLKGYYSIRVNNQWRIIFKWINNVAHEVKFTDYH